MAKYNNSSSSSKQEPNIKVIDTLKIEDNQRTTFLTGYLDDNRFYN